MPIMRENFFAIICTCGFQLMCSSSVNPKKLNSYETRSSGSEFDSSAGTRWSIYLCGWWKIMNLVLLTFTDNLYIRSHSCTHETLVVDTSCDFRKVVWIHRIRGTERTQWTYEVCIICIQKSFKLWSCGLDIIHINYKQERTLDRSLWNSCRKGNNIRTDAVILGKLESIMSRVYRWIYDFIHENTAMQLFKHFLSLAISYTTVKV